MPSVRQQSCGIIKRQICFIMRSSGLKSTSSSAQHTIFEHWIYVHIEYSMELEENWMSKMAALFLAQPVKNDHKHSQE